MSDTLWEQLTGCRRRGELPHGYPADVIRLYSPIDDLHTALKALLDSAQHSIVLNVYGYDDPELDEILHRKAADPTVYVQMNLDRSQAGGVHEHTLLEGWASLVGTSIAIGTSTAHAISHLKVCIIDGLYMVAGSTNWSVSGESKQDNELTITRLPALAAEARSILDRNHTAMLAQMHERA